ncbi:MAG: tannase/feruloyl esterase family alpha/beta hydrolase [Acidobacteriota bacterium]
MSPWKALVFSVTLFAFTALLAATSFAQQSCESLSRLKLPQTTISMAVSVPAGEFPLPNALPGNHSSVKVPAFCRVAGVIKPTADSDIRFEVWMPNRNWNGRFDGVGNGGFAGSIGYAGLAAAVRAGFAAASTDTGHAGEATDARWALGHPQKIVDFGYRAIHLTAVTGKAIVRKFYGASPHRSYFASCSNGGRQALMEAQRFPRDYNGIIAGAPANFWTHLLASAIWISQATLDNPASYIPPGKLPAISHAVLAACDAQDGVKDGILNDPRQCHFNPETLLCKGADSNACLTAPQITALKKIYAGPSNRKGEKIFPGFMPGGEPGPDGWPTWMTGPAPEKSLQYAFGTQFYSNMMFDNAKWNFRTLNFGADTRLTDRKMGPILNATNPNLTAFKSHGGKLILYHGWSDSAIPPLNTVNYYKSVLARMGRESTQAFVRLYMVPGMQHCGNGPGPSSFGAWPSADANPKDSMFGALEQWVEHGVAPRTIIATKNAQPWNPASAVEMTRPLCPYPEIAKYKGSGDIHQAANFFCTIEQKQ